MYDSMRLNYDGNIVSSVGALRWNEQTLEVLVYSYKDHDFVWIPVPQVKQDNDQL